MKLSVLTVHFNDLIGLERTALSIARQNIPDELEFEWLIQDGGTEGFAEFVASKPTLFGRAKVVSQWDGGIYAGMNLALGRARGEFVIFMNAGDEFDGHRAFERFFSLPTESADVLLGAATEIKDGVVLGTKAPRRSGLALRYGMPTHHQAIYYRRELLSKVPFEIKFRIAADYDQLLRLSQSGAFFYQFNDVVCLFELDGISSTSYREAQLEQARVRVMRGASGWHIEIPLLLMKFGIRFVRDLLPNVYARLRFYH